MLRHFDLLLVSPRGSRWGAISTCAHTGQRHGRWGEWGGRVARAWGTSTAPTTHTSLHATPCNGLILLGSCWHLLATLHGAFGCLLAAAALLLTRPKAQSLPNLLHCDTNQTTPHPPSCPLNSLPPPACPPRTSSKYVRAVSKHRCSPARKASTAAGVNGAHALCQSALKQ